MQWLFSNKGLSECLTLVNWQKDANQPLQPYTQTMTASIQKAVNWRAKGIVLIDY